MLICSLTIQIHMVENVQNVNISHQQWLLRLAESYFRDYYKTNK